VHVFDIGLLSSRSDWLWHFFRLPDVAFRSLPLPVSHPTSDAENSLSGATGHHVQLTLKRAFDITFAALALFLLLPLLVGITLLVSLDGGPPLVRHIRVGQGGRHFGCLMFRSMSPNAAAVLEEHLASNPDARREWDATQGLTDDPRLTRLGNFLRMTSLDELPQLVNVLLGDMSLVGPPPILPDEAAHYGDQIR
jgi:exopolysaccharide production protein ExoY